MDADRDCVRIRFLSQEGERELSPACGLDLTVGVDHPQQFSIFGFFVLTHDLHVRHHLEVLAGNVERQIALPLIFSLVTAWFIAFVFNECSVLFEAALRNKTHFQLAHDVFPVMPEERIGSQAYDRQYEICGAVFVFRATCLNLSQLRALQRHMP